MKLFYENGQPNLRAISELALFNGFTAADLQGLAAQLDFGSKQYQYGQAILRRGQRVIRPAVIIKGAAASGISLLGGDESNDMGHSGPGALLGPEAAFSRFGTSPCDIIAISPLCEVMHFNLDPLLHERIEPRLGLCFRENWLAQLSDRYVRMQYWIWVLSQRSLRDKILTYASIMSSRLGGNQFELRMTQDEFASYLRVARQSLNRELQAMQHDGVLHIEGRKYTVMRVPDYWLSPRPLVLDEDEYNS